MTAKGTVLSADKDHALVEVRRRAMCDGCPNDPSNPDSCGHACAMGSLLGDRKNMTVSVKNTLGAQPGDTVELESPDRSVLASAFLVFILPLILAFIFWFAAGKITSNELAAYAAAAAGFVLSFVICLAVEKKTKKTGTKIAMRSIISPQG